jgi:hypothetical protein
MRIESESYTRGMSLGIALALALASNSVAQDPPAAPRVEVVRTPHEGLQPRAADDARGVIHLVYFSGDPKGGELEYVRSTDAGKTFSEPLRVNSESHSAVAIGNVRGAQLALGRNGRVHVAWNGRHDDWRKAPMAYTRLDDAGAKFEPQRNVIASHFGLDGGGTVAADASGNVWVVWHAPADGGENEASRRVWVARSTDEGASFAPEIAASPAGCGVCPCCGLNACAADGSLTILFRTARDTVHRDTMLLRSTSSGFDARVLDEWRVPACVMSTCSLARTPRGVLGAFESDGQVRFAELGDQELALRNAPGEPATRKHPTIACNAAGDVLLAWTEGMTWGHAGVLAWQLFDRDGKPIEKERGTRNGVPPWSLISAIALADGRFAIFY